jgi:DNA-binding GntR family transcriptional regulator
MKNKNEKFMKVYYEFLNRKDITLTQGIILSYLKSYQDNEMICFESEKELAKMLKTSLSTVHRSIKDLEEKELIFKSQDRKYLIAYHNKKAIILVDENNPLPEKPVTDAETHAEETISENRWSDYEKQMKDLKREQIVLRKKQVEESKSRIEELLNNAPRLGDNI